MRKSYLFSFVAALSLAFVSIGLADSAAAQVRETESLGEVSETGGGSATLLVIGSLVAAILLVVAVSGGGDDERPVSP